MAQEAPSQTIKSGPPVGRTLTELRVVDVVGPRAGQERDGAKDLQKGPAAILFLHEISRNVAPCFAASIKLLQTWLSSA